MSVPTIASYFPFRRIKIISQSVNCQATVAHIQIKPDKRFQPICHECGKPAAGIHSWAQRKIRDLNMAATRQCANRYGICFSMRH